MTDRITRAEQLDPVKRGKLEREVLDAVAALPELTVRAIKLAETLGPNHPETLDAYKLISEHGLTIGRRARIRSGLPRGG